MIECCLSGKVKKKVQSALTDQTMLKTVNANSLLKQNGKKKKWFLPETFTKQTTLQGLYLVYVGKRYFS